MSRKLEDFIRQNKQAFEDHVPSDALWHRLEKKLDAGKNKSEGKVLNFRPWMKLAAAAIISAVIVSAAFYLFNRPEEIPPEMTAKNNPPLDSGYGTAKMQEDAVSVAPDSAPGITAPLNREKVMIKTLNEEEEALFHYARIIEIKQEQMKALKKTEPELYQAFTKDQEMLETAYGALKAQLKEGVNSEKLLEAMIGNLKMQADLLNKQLTILKEVRNKKTQDEKDYKSL
ncbi:hypothetical protein ABDK00_011515 [Niabella insulamsoli]|uniref:hypothetical protein n=1 Tax=Niabella insulamsoli TaxID=3144874 RepID=UPI0031FDE11B